MHYQSFLSFNVIGGFFWAMGMTLLGYFLGTLIPDVEKYLLPIIGAIIVISVIPALTHLKADDEDEEKEKGFSLLFRLKLFVKRLVRK